jgi:hypothetical protein
VEISWKILAHRPANFSGRPAGQFFWPAGRPNILAHRPAKYVWAGQVFWPWPNFLAMAHAFPRGPRVSAWPRHFRVASHAEKIVPNLNSLINILSFQMNSSSGPNTTAEFNMFHYFATGAHQNNETALYEGLVNFSPIPHYQEVPDHVLHNTPECEWFSSIDNHTPDLVDHTTPSSPRLQNLRRCLFPSNINHEILAQPEDEIDQSSDDEMEIYCDTEIIN